MSRTTHSRCNASHRPSYVFSFLGSAAAALAIFAAGCAHPTTDSTPSDGAPGKTPDPGNAPANAGARQPGSRLFAAAENPWHRDVSSLPKSPSSDAVIGWLDDAGGWGSGRMLIDFGINVLEADASTPLQSFEPTEDFYSPDCDEGPFPVPASGALEGEEGYQCETDGDCHLIVVHRPTNTLYEMWRANIEDGVFYGGCVAKWDLARSYDDSGRGDGCTSADAGGFPVAAMVFTADEVARGSIDHAIRFILPNSRIRDGIYVAPGTHTTRATSGGPDAPPYGVRFRLRASYPVEQLSPGAQVIARAMQRYGMLLADGGRIALTAVNDRFTQHKWDEVGVDAESLAGLGVSDFEVVGMGEPIEDPDDCTRNR